VGTEGDLAEGRGLAGRRGPGGGTGGARTRGEGADGEQAGKRAEDAAGGGGRGQKFGGGGLGEQGLQLHGTGRGLGAEGGHQPASAGRQRGNAAMGAGGAGLAGFWQAAGGEAGHQALEAAGGAVEAGPERDDEGGEARLAQETAGDQGGKGVQDEAEPTGKVGGEGLDRGGDGSGLHDSISNIKGQRAQGNNGRDGPMRLTRRCDAGGCGGSPGRERSLRQQRWVTGDGVDRTEDRCAPGAAVPTTNFID